MKKGTLASIVIATALVAALGAFTGCSSSSTSSSASGSSESSAQTTVVNPMTEVSSAKEMTTQTGATMNVDTLTWKNVKYFVYNLDSTKMAEVQFTSMSFDCTYRGEVTSDQSADISGVEGDFSKTSTHAVKKDDVKDQTINLKCLSDGSAAVASWYNTSTGTAYCVVLMSDSKQDADTFMDDAYTLALTCLS